MLFDRARHEPLRPVPWDERVARATIDRIVADTERSFTEDRYWPLHALDAGPGDEPATGATPLYHGACGVFWALHYLEGAGAARLSRYYLDQLETLAMRNRTALGASAVRERASFWMGDTPIRMLAYGVEPTDALERELDALIAGNVDHPSRELMWGAPGTLLAALFLHERTGGARWADLFRRTAAALWRQLAWSPQHQCAYWTQNLYGGQSTYLGAAHGFVAAAVPLIRGRHLLGSEERAAWERCIVHTVRRTADRVGDHANWRPQLDRAADAKRILQFCHGAPGFVVCLAGLPDAALDDVLIAAAETIWIAGPLAKGAGLCHGTGGNGYALLEMHGRTGDVKWLERARAFAMHGVAQTREHAQRYGQGRYSLWTGDLGFAIYLWDCVRARAAFPTLDVFYGGGTESSPSS